MFADTCGEVASSLANVTSITACTLKFVNNMRTETQIIILKFLLPPFIINCLSIIDSTYLIL